MKILKILLFIFTIYILIIDLNAQNETNFLSGKWKVLGVLYTLTGPREDQEEAYNSCFNRLIKINDNGFHCQRCSLLQEKFLVKLKIDSIVHIDSLRNIYADYLVDFLSKKLNSEYVTIYELNLPLENEGIEYPIVFCSNTKQLVLYIHDFFFYMEKIE
jgi:hypothetical protein